MPGRTHSLLKHFLPELRRRGVIQAVTAYTVSAWLVIQVFNELGPVFALPAWVSSLVGTIALVGFPVACYISWFFDFSGGRLTRSGLAEEGELKPLSPWHWLGLGVIAVAASASGYLLFQQLQERLGTEEAASAGVDIEQSMAVIPFRDLSPTQDQTYLAEGLAEELTTVLGRISDLRIAASSASFSLTADGLDPIAVGRELDTASVLTGSVQSSGDRLRVRVELIDTGDGAVLWSESFRRKLSDIFSVQEDIARSVTNLLQDRYLEANELAGSTTASSDAYVFYLKGRAGLRERTAEAIKRSRRLFEQSIGLDPEFAPAYVGLAETMWLLADGGETFGNIDPEVAAQVARQNVERALVINDQLPEAYANLGRVEAILQDDASALSHYDKALSLNPNLPQVHLWRYLSLKALQRYQESMQALETAAKLDPTAPVILHNLGFEQSLRGNFAEARRTFESLISQAPENPLGHRGLADAAFREGNLALSLRHWQRAMTLSPETGAYREAYAGVLFGLQMPDAFRPFAEISGGETSQLLIEGRYEALHERMDFLRAANPEDPWIAFEAAWYHYLDGNDEVAAAILVENDSLFSDEDRFGSPMCSPGIELALAHRQAGDANTASAYAAECAGRLDSARGRVYSDSALDYLAARLAAFRGERDKAAEELSRAVDNGWREWWTARDPLLAPLASHPVAQAAVQRIETSLAAQRERVETDLADVQS
jgi:TolB-like protein/Tfp pilus assembly protein PilF